MKPTKKFQEFLRAKQDQASEISKPEQNERLNRELVIIRLKYAMELACRKVEKANYNQTNIFKSKSN